MDGLFGMKELYDVALKTTYPVEINGNKIEQGETIALFDRIQLAGLDELKARAAATGGFDNRSLITWEDTKEVNFSFSQGVFSKIQFALLSNSKLIETQKEEKIYLIPKREIKESNENGLIEFTEIPVDLFVYNEDTGEKIKDYTKVDETHYNINKPFLKVVTDYYFSYQNGATQIIIGRKLLYGFLRMEARTRIKDDTTGRTTTGIITIPKLKLTSDLSMRLGKNASPVVANFSAVGHPIGEKGNKTVVDMLLLNDDIDSDI